MTSKKIHSFSILKRSESRNLRSNSTPLGRSGRAPMKILIIQQNMIGDVLTSSILFEALRKKFPEAELHYLIQPFTHAVVENNPDIDKVILFDPKVQGRLRQFWVFCKEIRKTKYEVVIDVYAKINSAFITASTRAEKRISYHKWYTSKAYTNVVLPKTKPISHAGLAIENRMLLLQVISPAFPVALKPKIYLTDSERATAKKILENSGISAQKPLFMISILGSSPKKTYPLKYMAEVLEYIVAESHAQLLFNYIPKQKKEAELLFRLCSVETQKNIFFDVFGKNLREFIAITSFCDALLGNEGGAVNMAKALNVPTFAVFSPQIKKENWNIYEDGNTNISVHLNDYNPDFLKDISKKDLSKKSGQFYELLKPNLIFAELKKFLEINSKK